MMNKKDAVQASLTSQSKQTGCWIEKAFDKQKACLDVWYGQSARLLFALIGQEKYQERDDQ